MCVIGIHYWQTGTLFDVWENDCVIMWDLTVRMMKFGVLNPDVSMNPSLAEI